MNLDLSTRWRTVISFKFLPLYPRDNRPQYPSDRRLDVFQRQSARYGQEKNLFPLTEIEPWLLGRPAPSRCTDWAISCSEWMSGVLYSIHSLGSGRRVMPPCFSAYAECGVRTEQGMWVSTPWPPSLLLQDILILVAVNTGILCHYRGPNNCVGFS